MKSNTKEVLEFLWLYFMILTLYGFVFTSIGYCIALLENYYITHGINIK
jgi:hypothetical protein